MASPGAPPFEDRTAGLRSEKEACCLSPGIQFWPGHSPWSQIRALEALGPPTLLLILNDAVVECASISLQAVFTQTSRSIGHESISGVCVTNGVFPFEKKEVHVSGVKIFYGYKWVRQRVTSITVYLPGCPVEGSEWFCTGLEETSKMFAFAKHI